MLARMWRKRSSFALLVGMQAGTVTLENSLEVPQKIKNRSTLQPSNCTTRYLLKGYKNTYLKWYMHPDVYSSIINNSQIIETVHVHWWMDKEDMVYIHNGILLSHQKEWNLAIAMTWMEIECIMLSEISQSEKDKYHMISLMGGI